ncbi:MAG: ATP-binding protein [Peptococcaceae bacterium]|jgi:hypothetical protein|nr:ATP-binding protein [Peptococcaceae bacterium]
MSVPVLNRLTAEISRSSEYFNIKELQAQTGQSASNFASVILKEVVDNALDACESAGVAPEVTMEVAAGDGTLSISVADNGKGLPPEVIQRILDFQVRVSDKLLYRSPSRGAQGNALKTVLGLPFALGSITPVVIDSLGVKNTIRARTDPLGEVRVDHRRENSPVVQGTRVMVEIPERGQQFAPGYWAQGFTAFNPHALVKIRRFKNPSQENEQANFSAGQFSKTEDLNQKGNCFQPTVTFPGEWRKFLPTDLTSAHWYTADSMERLIYAHILDGGRGGKDFTLREFIKQFRGLSPNAKAKAICNLFPSISRLSDFAGRPGAAADLLAAMQKAAPAPKPEVMGFVGEVHFREVLDGLYGVKRYWYKRLAMELDGVPYVIEAAVAETQRGGDVYHGVNFSPTFDDPLSNTVIPGPKFRGFSLRSFLNNAHCDPYGDERGYGIQTAVVFHLISPGMEFLDRGKTRLKLPGPVAEMVGAALWSVTKTIYQEEERRRRDAARQEKQDREREREQNRESYTLKEAVFEVLPEALDKATGGGQYPVSARTLYYQVRPLIQEYTSKELDYNYFSQDLLVQYQQENGPIGNLYYDPRGVLYEPHTGKSVPLGTREVEQYVFPDWVYDKILFVEKKGLWPVLEVARLAERYDMAVIASEGFATEAARRVLEKADRERDYRLFVLHDADPAGYNIARTLREETRRMPGYHVEVLDLGLKLKDALDMGLQTEEFTRQNALPEALELSDMEKKYFVGRQVSRKSWVCQRVELNAMSAPQLVEFIERKLAEAGATAKVLPPEGVVIDEAKDSYTELIEQLAEDKLMAMLRIPEMVKLAAKEAGNADLSDLYDLLAERLSDNPPESWRDLVVSDVEALASGALRKVQWEDILKKELS